MVDAGMAGIQSKAIQPGAEKTGEYHSLLPGQTVCTVKDEKGKGSLGTGNWGQACNMQFAFYASLS